ncbi:hypothetical protein PFICI_02371 [Pestalotiopsis fici W106-1]|uniref:Uncharacterized protein n=1 Tax=Pestalotiopsis fici (strain W106-1 / CGMCC3.15140) TaxID=1229662 RepID=W3XGL7_PESFW|nr:uncharacterized protein PFICI_02371 [Pestalotiopsis fici W106-1]ETS84346.1 hypothetical protein PFICI_02371 [Pestalotiopsis fici W106-1]
MSKSTSSLVGGVVFVTGGASGIGKGTIFGFIASGVKNIAISDVDRTALEAWVAELSTQYENVDVLAIPTDVSSEPSVNAAIEATVKRFGRIDIAVNNAGVSGPRGEAFDISFQEWQSTININLNGVWLCQRAEIKQISKGLRYGRGVIVNVSSMYGVVGISSSMPATVYAASKHAVIGLTRTEANKYAQHGIRINAICPGYVDTALLKEATAAGHMEAEILATPMKRIGQVEEVVDCIIFLASSMSSFMSGSTLIVDGGYTSK